MGVEQHLVGLQKISPDEEGTAVRQLDMGHLQLRVFAADRCPVLAPVKLEGFPGLEGERHEGSPASALALALPFLLPAAGEGGNAVVGALVAERREFGMQLLQRPPLLSRLAGLAPQPGRQLVRVGVQLARPLGDLELRVYRPGPEVLGRR